MEACSMPHEVIMPALGMAQETGLIVAWLKQPGEIVKAGDPLMEVETDKAVMEVAAQADGFLTNVRASAGDTVPVGDVVALISETPADLHTTTSSRESEPHSLAAPIPPSPVELKSNSIPAPRAPNAFAELGPKATDRIFVSPKARRLAAEQGLDLSRLVAAGVPQPYHVSDLDTLRALPAAVAPDSAPASRHLTARVRGDGFVAFCEWMRVEAGAYPEPASVMASMAAATLRQGAPEKSLIVVAEAFGQKRIYIDPDRLGLGRGNSVETGESATLILRDLRGTAVSAIRMGGEAAPVLSITCDGPDMLITLECAPGQLPPETALTLISGFAGQLSEPLRHLL
jgi:pyruvate/2-oxoglutarate dehydrogenase complex dihydrolipoamide acyltransferase (E2) component